jgi:phenylpyruvate tautomerase PptA (4-oxalocrotonate tautomerase family)
MAFLPLPGGRDAAYGRPMPLLRLSVTPGAFDAERRAAFIQAITDAACTAEQLPPDPLARLRAVVIWHELAPGNFVWGGEVLDDQVRAAFVDYSVGDGILDPVRRDRFAGDLHRAAEAGARTGDTRQTVTSVIFTDVAEGRWGRDGTLHRLPAMAHAAGFLHLIDIAAP